MTRKFSASRRRVVLSFVKKLIPWIMEFHAFSDGRGVPGPDLLTNPPGGNVNSPTQEPYRRCEGSGVKFSMSCRDRSMQGEGIRAQEDQHSIFSKRTPDRANAWMVFRFVYRRSHNTGSITNIAGTFQLAPILFCLTPGQSGLQSREYQSCSPTPRVWLPWLPSEACWRHRPPRWPLISLPATRWMQARYPFRAYPPAGTWHSSSTSPFRRKSWVPASLRADLTIVRRARLSFHL